LRRGRFSTNTTLDQFVLKGVQSKLLTQLAYFGNLLVVPRKLRVQYPGAIYHIMHRGDRAIAIFRDDR
jgi:hypothetical protein